MVTKHFGGGLIICALYKRPFLGHGRENQFAIGALQIIRLNAKIRESYLMSDLDYIRDSK